MFSVGSIFDNGQHGGVLWKIKISVQQWPGGIVTFAAYLRGEINL